MDPVPPLVSFVIPVRNDAESLRRCLGSIERTTYPPERLEIVVVDNDSVDCSAAVAHDAGATVTRASSPTVGALRNHGARVAKGEILAFVDADHLIDPGWPSAAAEALQAPDVGVAGASYHAPPDGTWVQRTYDTLRAHPSGTVDVSWLGSGNLAMWRRVFDDVHGFDEALTACEDVDFCRRVRLRGYRLVSDARLRSVHFGDPAGLGALFRSELWRGRNNLRVSLRRPLSAREIPSILMPIGELALLVALVAGLGAAPWIGLSWPLWAASIVVGLGLLRALRVVAIQRRASLVLLAQAFIVCTTYDLARALALVLRAQHRRSSRNRDD